MTYIERRRAILDHHSCMCSQSGGEVGVCIISSGTLEFYNERLRHTRTVAVEELKTVRQDTDRYTLNGESAQASRAERDEHKIFVDNIFYISLSYCL